MKRPARQEIEVLSEKSNYVVLRTTGRSFPGIVLQGDSLASLNSLARSVAERLSDMTTEEDEALWEAQALHDALFSRLLHYQDVLEAHGVGLPYPRLVSAQDRLRLVSLDEDDDNDGDDRDLTEQERAQVQALSRTQVDEIDSALLAEISPSSWRKVARVVSAAMSQTNHVSAVPDLFYAERLRALVGNRRVLARGNPFSMSRCEVRLGKD